MHRMFGRLLVVAGPAQADRTSGDRGVAGMTAGPAEAVAARVEAVRRRVERQGRDPDAVRIVAVTKGFGPEAVGAAVAAGLLDVGENYAQELVAKAAAAPARETRWHFLGPVQRNKVSKPGAPG